MATWVYDPATARYRQPSGRVLTQAQLLDVRNAIADGFEEEVGLLVAAWFAGTMSFAEWTLAFGALITAGVTAAYLLGYGGKAAYDDHAATAIDAIVLAQLVYAKQFITDVGESMLGDTPMSQAAMTARAKLYSGSPILSFEQGQAAANGATSLPYMPADGLTPCHCITTPTSQVVTQRGMIPIADVIVGDMVLTHRKRWRPVTHVLRTLSGAHHRQALITAPNGQVVGCTDDHRLLTQNGWVPAKDIGNDSRSRYNGSHEDVQHVRETAWQSIKDRYMSGLPSLVRLWKSERSSRGTLHFLRNADQSQETMGCSGNTREDGIGYEASLRSDSHALRQLDHRFIPFAEARRWSILCTLLGQHWSQAINLSLSMGLAAGEWANPQGNGYSPQRRRSNPRRPSQSRTHDQIGSSTVAPYTGARNHNACRSGVGPSANDHDDVRAMWKAIYGEATAESTATLLFSPMPDRVDANASSVPYLWTDLHWWIGSWRSPEILQSGMLPLATTLYDLTVAEDESFVVEGVVVHNSRCRCFWTFENINETETHAYWHTQEDGGVCDGCLKREAESDPFILTPQIDIRGKTPTTARRIPLLKQDNPYPTKPTKPTLEPSDVE